jgi:hypothetical protein
LRHIPIAIENRPPGGFQASGFWLSVLLLYPEASQAASVPGCKRVDAGILACLSSRLHQMDDQGFTVIPSSLPTGNCTEQRPGRQRYFRRREA